MRHLLDGYLRRQVRQCTWRRRYNSRQRLAVHPYPGGQLSEVPLIHSFRVRRKFHAPGLVSGETEVRCTNFTRRSRIMSAWGSRLRIRTLRGWPRFPWPKTGSALGSGLFEDTFPLMNSWYERLFSRWASFKSRSPKHERGKNSLRES